MIKVYHDRMEVPITKSGHESCRWNISLTVPTENKGHARRENGERMKSYRGEWTATESWNLAVNDRFLAAIRERDNVISNHELRPECVFTSNNNTSGRYH